MAKELSRVERTPKGKQARQYFIASEGALTEARRKLEMPTQPQALRLWADALASGSRAHGGCICHRGCALRARLHHFYS